MSAVPSVSQPKATQPKDRDAAIMNVEPPNHGILELRRWGADFLRNAGIESPQLDAELLLAAVLGWDRTMLFSRGDQLLTDAARERFAELLERRSRQEPVAYLLGEREFFGRRFAVNRSVLIPRPETELIIERALVVLGEEKFRENKRPPLVIDVGTGSGAIAVTIALEMRSRRCEAAVIGSDLSAAALAVARSNAVQLGAAELNDAASRDPDCDDSRAVGRSTLSFFQGDLLTPCVIPSDRPVLVLANLPYVDEDDELPPGVEQFEPISALRAADRGLAQIWRLFLQVFRPVVATARAGPVVLLLELGAPQAPLLLSRIAALGGRIPVFHRDLQGIDRVAELRE